MFTVHVVQKANLCARVWNVLLACLQRKVKRVANLIAHDMVPDEQNKLGRCMILINGCTNLVLQILSAPAKHQK